MKYLTFNETFNHYNVRSKQSNPSNSEHFLLSPKYIFGMNLSFNYDGWFGDSDYYQNPEFGNTTSEFFFLLADSLSNSSSIIGRFAGLKIIKYINTENYQNTTMKVLYSKSLDLTDALWMWPYNISSIYWEQIGITLNHTQHHTTGSYITTFWNDTSNQLILTQNFTTPDNGVIIRTIDPNYSSVVKLEIFGDLFFNNTDYKLVYGELNYLNHVPFPIDIHETTLYSHYIDYRSEETTDVENISSSTNITQDPLTNDPSDILLFIISVSVLIVVYTIIRFLQKRNK